MLLDATTSGAGVTSLLCSSYFGGETSGVLTGMLSSVVGAGADLVTSVVELVVSGAGVVELGTSVDAVASTG